MTFNFGHEAMDQSSTPGKTLYMSAGQWLRHVFRGPNAPPGRRPHSQITRPGIRRSPLKGGRPVFGEPRASKLRSGSQSVIFLENEML